MGRENFNLLSSSNTCERREGRKDPVRNASDHVYVIQRKISAGPMKSPQATIACSTSPTGLGMECHSSSIPTVLSHYLEQPGSSMAWNNARWIQRCKDNCRLPVSSASRAGYLRGKFELDTPRTLLAGFFFLLVFLHF